MKSNCSDLQPFQESALANTKLQDQGLEQKKSSEHQNEVKRETTAQDEINNQMTSLFEELRQRWINKSVGSNDSESNSSFASSSDQDQFERAAENNGELFIQEQTYKPLYRQEHGGILIYDNEAIIPNQPAPSFYCENNNHCQKVSS